MFVRLTAAMCCLLSLFSLPGCRSEVERASIKGTVKFDGQPVKSGSIAFIPSGTNVGPATGAEIKDGKYGISKEQGPVLGLHRVEILATRSSAGDSKEAAAPTGGPSAAKGTATFEMYIPEKYNKQSTLEFIVESGSNEEDFDLKSE